MPDRPTLRQPGSAAWRTAPELPASLLKLLDADTYGATCDWGRCDRPTDGLAHRGDEQWLEICHGCANGHPRDPAGAPVAQFFSFLEIERALDPAD